MSGHEDTEQHLSGAPHATFREYMIGFWLSVGLTIVPFWLVLGNVLDDRGLTIFYIIAFGTVQMVVHMVFFLHMNTKSENGWLLMSLSFTLLLVIIAIAGSVWIMFHLDRNMMPMMIDTVRALP